MDPHPFLGWNAPAEQLYEFGVDHPIVWSMPPPPPKDPDELDAWLDA